jgi:glycosyltransferase involved in cell wall biosynthesis
MKPSSLTSSVVVISYKRIATLPKCLDALERMEVRADEVIVVTRDIDQETQAFLTEWIAGDPTRRRMTIVSKPGQLVAMEAGVTMSRGDIVAFTDDDAQPHTDWMKRILEHYERDPSVGGVGGRDLLWRNGVFMDGKAQRVGYIDWLGREVGDTYLDFPGVQEVDTFKGVNMSFRRQYIRFDHNLLGTPTIWPSDVSITLGARKMGVKLICDPKILVDHYEFPRQKGDERKVISLEAYMKKSHNITYLILKYLPWYRWPIFLIYSFLIGQQNTPGLFYDLLHGQKTRFDVLKASLQGKLLAFQTLRRWYKQQEHYSQVVTSQ